MSVDVRLLPIEDDAADTIGLAGAALAVMLGSTPAKALDAGQRATVVQAVERLDQVYGELNAERLK